MKKLSVICPVIDGQIDVHTRRTIADCIKECGLAAIQITVEPYKHTRSNQQNAYYWGVVIEAVREMFEDYGQSIHPDEVHEYLKLRVGKLSKVVLAPDGEPQIVVKSSATLLTTDFELYLEKVRAWAAQYGCLIPLPNETIAA